MPCTQGKTSLTDIEINSFLRILQNEPLTVEEISSRMNVPLFQVKSKVRELTRLEYLERKGDKYYRVIHED
jgi:predicted transcriptional regulator